MSGFGRPDALHLRRTTEPMGCWTSGVIFSFCWKWGAAGWKEWLNELQNEGAKESSLQWKGHWRRTLYNCNGWLPSDGQFKNLTWNWRNLHPPSGSNIPSIFSHGGIELLPFAAKDKKYPHMKKTVQIIPRYFCTTFKFKLNKLKHQFKMLILCSERNIASNL